MEEEQHSASPLDITVRNAPVGFHAEFLAKRLDRVARISGVPMPKDMTYEQIAEVAGTILGQIAEAIEFQTIDTAPKDGTRILCWVPWPDRPAWQTGIFYNGEFWPDRRNAASLMPTLWRPLNPPRF